MAGFKAVMTIQEDIPSAGTISMKGVGSFSQSRVGSLTLYINVPEVAAAGIGTLQMSAVLDHTTEYIKLPALIASRAPGIKPWIEINFAQLGNSSEASAVSTLMRASNQLSDPSQYFYYLKAITAGSLRSLGQETVDGYRTTHYRGDENLSQLATLVPADQRAAVQQAIASIRSRAGLGRSIPVDVWIDSRDLVRRLVVNETLNDAGKTITLSVREDFPQYGPQPAPAIPPASEVTNVSSLAAGSGL